MKGFYERYWETQEVLDDFQYKWPVIRRFIPENKKIKILDFGCGKGVISGEVLRMNPKAQLTGVDVSNEALRFVKKKFPKQTFYKISDGDKLPFKDNYYDFILASDVLEHVYDTENAFAELARVLKPNGTILISVPYNGKIKNVIITLFFFEFVFNPYSPHIRFFSKRTLADCLKKVGLQPLTWKYFGRFYPFSSGMCVLAEK